ncbi:MAG: hypothetical protein AB8H86_33695 [Polyangiales bacterium]
MRELQTEGLDADTEALLRWDFARHLENTDDPAGAVKAYLVSYNLTPAFRPPLDALVRIFGRRRSFKNLKRLLETTLKSTSESQGRASAMLDLASFAERHEEDRNAAIEWAERALETDPASRFAAYTLERLGRGTGDPSLITRSLEARALTTDDVVLKGLFLHDLAEARAAEDDIDAAVLALDEAAQLPAVRWRSFAALERLARKFERPADLARALEGLGALALAAPGGEPVEGSGAFQMDRFSDEQRSRGEGVACLYEAAMLRLESTDEPEAAAALLARASEIRADDAFIRRAYIRALRAAGDVDGVAAEAGRLADSELPDDIKASLLYEAALATQGHDHPAAMATLEQARALAPHSAALEATENHWLQSGGYLTEWVKSLERPLPEGASAETRSETSANLWRAAIVSSRRLKDFARARKSFERAALYAEDSLPVLRDLYEECLVHGEYGAAQDVLAAMWTQDLEDEERSSLHADRVRLAVAAGDDATLRTHLEAALADESTHSWAPDAVRLFAARLGDFNLLASAHEALASNAGPDDDAAAALASAARAARLAGDESRAEQNARAALERFPGHRYAAALLEEILRAQGKSDEVVALLRSAAEARQGDAAAVVSLLSAGAAAEASGDSKLAADTYEQAADLDPTDESPLWALARLGAQNDDNGLVLRALEALSELELQGQGAGHATLALGEHYAVRASKSELSEAPLEACLDTPELAPDAAFALAIQGESAIDPALRLRALRLLSKSAPQDAMHLLRDAGVTAATGELAPDAVDELSEELRALDAQDPFAVLVSLLNAPAAERADAWLNLSNSTTGATREAFTLHGLRSMMASGTDASADAFMIAQELAGSESEFAAIAVDETLEASDDADPRSEALIGRISLASEATAASLLAGAGRAATEARRPEAVDLLQRAIDAQPDDLVSWEAMRVAARDASDWPRVAEACDHLAIVLGEGPFYCELVEESAAVRMDYLGDDDGARKRLMRLFESEPGRAKAYHRLHDLLQEAGDTHGLSQLVARRISAIDDSDQLERLFYEQARLHRSHGKLEDALLSLENLDMLNEGHVGGIALAIEINVALEQWDEAVDSLRALAAADVPNKQRRIALLGAADFLERKKGDSAAALTELRRIEELGLADNALYVRMADVALRAGQSQEAVRTLLNAADQYGGSERAHLLRRAAAVQREDLGDEGGALLSYRQALSIEPTNMESAEAVAALLPAGEMRHAHASQFAESVRAALRTSTINLVELQKLQSAAEWLDDRVMREAVVEVIEVLGLDETRQTAPEAQRPLPKRQLTREEILGLQVAPAQACAELASAAEETLAAMEGLELGTLGLTRRDTVSKDDGIRAALESASAAYGIPMGEVYRGGSSPERILAVPGKRDRTDWVVGANVQGVVHASQAFEIGRQAYAAYAHLRSFSPHGAAKGATMLFAACAAAGRALPEGEGRPGVSEWTRAAEGAMSRRGRKNIVAAVTKAQASGAVDVERFLGGALHSMNRTGLLFSQNIRVALESVLAAEPTTERLLRSADGLDVVHTWLSPTFIDLRKKLGLK